MHRSQPFFKIFSCAAGIVMMMLLCSCISNVSQDPKYNYGYKYNHVYKTIDEVLLDKATSYADVFALKRMKPVDKEDRDSYLSLSSRLNVLPKGTLFKVERLTLSINPENSSLFVTVKILNGHFKGTEAVCFLTVYQYDWKKELEKWKASEKELGVVPEIPDPALVVDLGEMPEYDAPGAVIPEPDPITYRP
ncbi:hypothetical protein SDC9_114321 [bioreactor metagenome]|uniref:Uncharacterized protein n=1 Tax=bioreactor metagenome TaxID=1076179 RepID=A0A645BPN9_9ZZZZ